jgi:hypothetical protein
VIKTSNQPGSKVGWGGEGGVGRGGRGEEVAQTIYTHVNKKLSLKKTKPPTKDLTTDAQTSQYLKKKEM